MTTTHLSEVDSLATSFNTLTVSPFRIFDLPSEIRNEIYRLVLFAVPVADLQKTVRWTTNKTTRKRRTIRIPILIASKRFHLETSYILYSSQKFRVFPIDDFNLFPTLLQVAPIYRSYLTNIELVLGPGWTKPPSTWTINSRLGLAKMTAVQTLKIFVQTDPADPIFKDFRVSESFYTDFSGDLVKKMLRQLPNLRFVYLDANPSVKLDGPLMGRLIIEAVHADKTVRYGPLKGG